MIREREMNKFYGEYVDYEPCLPYSISKPTEEIQLSSNLNVLDKISIYSKIMEVWSKEERAEETARYYRDRCADLKSKVLQLQSEKVQIKQQAVHEKIK